MKYKVGNIVTLYSGESMYIYAIDETNKLYYATNCDDDSDSRKLMDSEIMQLLLEV